MARGRDREFGTNDTVTSNPYNPREFSTQGVWGNYSDRIN